MHCLSSLCWNTKIVCFDILCLAAHDDADLFLSTMLRALPEALPEPAVAMVRLAPRDPCGRVAGAGAGDEQGPQSRRRWLREQRGNRRKEAAHGMPTPLESVVEGTIGLISLSAESQVAGQLIYREMARPGRIVQDRGHTT